MKTLHFRTLVMSDRAFLIPSISSRDSSDHLSLVERVYLVMRETRVGFIKR